MENPAKSALEIARLQVLEWEDRVWTQAVRVEELRASGAGIEADEQLLNSLRERLRQERNLLRQGESRKSEVESSLPYHHSPGTGAASLELRDGSA